MLRLRESCRFLPVLLLNLWEGLPEPGRGPRAGGPGQHLAPLAPSEGLPASACPQVRQDSLGETHLLAAQVHFLHGAGSSIFSCVQGLFYLRFFFCELSITIACFPKKLPAFLKKIFVQEDF